MRMHYCVLGRGDSVEEWGGMKNLVTIEAGMNTS
jgi:hypothetical protein